MTSWKKKMHLDENYLIFPLLHLSSYLLCAHQANFILILISLALTSQQHFKELAHALSWNMSFSRLLGLHTCLSCFYTIYCSFRTSFPGSASTKPPYYRKLQGSVIGPLLLSVYLFSQEIWAIPKASDSTSTLMTSITRQEFFLSFRLICPTAYLALLLRFLSGVLNLP